jgi:hypothetical protein
MKYKAQRGNPVVSCLISRPSPVPCRSCFVTLVTSEVSPLSLLTNFRILVMMFRNSGFQTGALHQRDLKPLSSMRMARGGGTTLQGPSIGTYGLKVPSSLIDRLGTLSLWSCCWRRSFANAVECLRFGHLWYFETLSSRFAEYLFHHNICKFIEKKTFATHLESFKTNWDTRIDLNMMKLARVKGTT